MVHGWFVDGLWTAFHYSLVRDKPNTNPCRCKDLKAEARKSAVNISKKCNQDRGDILVWVFWTKAHNCGMDNCVSDANNTQSSQHRNKAALKNQKQDEESQHSVNLQESTKRLLILCCDLQQSACQWIQMCAQVHCPSTCLQMKPPLFWDVQARPHQNQRGNCKSHASMYVWTTHTNQHDELWPPTWLGRWWN